MKGEYLLYPVINILTFFRFDPTDPKNRHFVTKERGETFRDNSSRL